MKIPVLNIYYMLSYSWNCLEEKNQKYVDNAGYESMINLLCRVLINGSKHLIKKGLDREYIPEESAYNGIKGKVNLSASVKTLNLINRKAICEFDELNYNVIHNQIIKSTIYRLINSPSIDKSLKHELKSIYRNFHKVNTIPLTPKSFRRVQLHKNIKHYRLLINICKLIYDNSTLNEDNGNYLFKDFVRDDTKMAVLFESFLFKFYSHNLQNHKVYRESLNWNLLEAYQTKKQFLPRMFTDISIITPDKSKIIVDAKYYPKTLLSSRFGKKTFHSQHMYQLFSYMLNQSRDILEKGVKGILIYPRVEIDLNEKFIYNNHEIQISTIDLNQKWHKVESDLMSFII